MNFGNNLCILVTVDHTLTLTSKKPELFVSRDDMDKIIKDPNIAYNIIDTMLHRDFTLGILGDKVDDIYNEDKKLELPEIINLNIGGLYYSEKL